MKHLALFALCSVCILSLSACNNHSHEYKQGKDQKSNTIQQDKNTGEKSKDNTKTENETTFQECMVGCEMMRKSNEGNKDKSDNDMQKDCSALCHSSQGIENDDTSSCEKSEGVLKDVCYTDIAKTKKEEGLCEKVIDKTMQSACYSALAEIKKDKALCEKVTEAIFKDICLKDAE